MRKILSIYLVLLVSTTSIFPQEFAASVDKTTIGQNERFQIYFTFQNGDLNKLSKFQAPDFKGLKILSGPNESRSMQIINGQVSGSLTYSFIAVGPNVGKVTIGSASLNYDGSSITSEPISITIVQGTQKTNQQVDKDLGISKEDLNKNVFIRAIPNKWKVKKGEQITVTYKLYTKLNISSPQISKLPTFNGFWSEDLETAQNIQFGTEMYKGERYRSATIKKVALFPTKSGKLSLTPFELNIPVIVKKKRTRNDIFDDFFNDSFFGRTETIDHLTKSNRLTIEVEPLPNNAPSSFSGAVGKFDFNVELDKNEVDLNEAITVKARISGSGNISLLKLPDLEFPAGFEKYEPKSTEKIYRKNVVSGRKNIEFLIVPRIPGKKEIPPIEFTYYDLGKDEYVTLSSKPFTINVKEGEGGYNQNVAGYTKEDVKLLNEDIRFIKTSGFNFRKVEDIASISVMFWFGIILPLGILGALLFIRKRHDSLSDNTTLLKFKKADKIAKSQLKEATKSLEQNNLADYYNKLSAALFGFLGNKLNIQTADFTLDKAIAKLEDNDFDQSLVDELKKVAEKCEFARFAPNAVGNDSGGTIYKSVENIIQEIETKLTLKK